jgi:4-hydroxybenzoyl-CoA thioesterase
MHTPFLKQEIIRFRHADNAGIVFYPRFLEMLNDLVEDWCGEALGNPFGNMHKTHGLPTVDLKVQFMKAATIGDTLNKKLWVIRQGNSSVTCGFRFEFEDGNPCLGGELTLVYVSLAGGEDGIRSAPFPEEMKKRIATFLLNNEPTS